MYTVMLIKPNRIQEMSWYLYRQSLFNLSIDIESELLYFF